MNIKCIAIDDEPLALDIIKNFCQRIGSIDLSVYSNPYEGMRAIKEQTPDIVFLDIEMEDITGLAIAAQLPENTCFIFTTAYLEYAIAGFELDAVDYLHKPFAFSRFETAITKALRRIRERAEVLPEKPEARNIVVKQEYNNVSIPLDDILYIEAMEGYSKIFRVSGVCTISRIILKNIGSLLPKDEFIRIHRSFIVNKSKVTSFNKQELQLATGKKLPIGRQYAADIASLLSGK